MYTQRVLDEWASPLDCSSLGTPSVADYSNFLGKAAHSAPGPDGIPFAAWENCGQLGAETLFLYGAHLAGGDVPHDDFNESIMVFVPKDVTDREEIEGDIVRGPMALRPLSLKNTDNKTIAGLTNNRLSPVLSKQSFWIQRGFIRGRSMLRNTLDLDTVMRLASFRTDLFPILVLFDFAAAFPSIFHCWLLTIIEFSGLPVGMINVIRAMYSSVKAFVHSSDGLILLFHILSGVLQGCPLSGSLFMICIEHFIRRLYALIDAKSLGCTRVCADDIGIVLRDRMVLKRLKGVFDTAALVDGAVLKPVKWIIVPIAVVFF